MQRRWLVGGLSLLLTSCGVGLVKTAAPLPVAVTTPEFSVTYPGAFRQSDPTNSTIYIGKQGLITKAYDAGRLAPTVGYTSILVSELPREILQQYPPPKLIAALTADLQQKRAKILKNRPRPNGQSLTISLERNGETNFTRLDYLLIGKRLFQVTLSTKKLENLEEPDYQNFFNSFKPQSP